MKKIYFMRHGQSEANAAKVVAGGGMDSPLTRLGMEQAAKVGRQLKDKKIQLIVSSPMKRAYHSAVVLANELGYPADKIVLSDFFRERHLGDLTGKPHDEVQLYFDINATPPGGESTEQVHTRIIEGLSWLKTLEADRILVVSHGGPGRMLRAIYRDEQHRTINSLASIGNAELLEVDL